MKNDDNDIFAADIAKRLSIAQYVKDDKAADLRYLFIADYPWRLFILFSMKDVGKHRAFGS